MMQLEDAIGEKCEIEIAESADETLEVLQELRERGEQVDIVITDEIMPGMQGSQLLEIIHRIDPNIMKVMLTGQAGFDDVVYAVNNAALDWCIKKPWDYDELKSTVIQLLEIASERRRTQRLAEEVFAEKNKAEAIVHSITDGIIVFNGEDKISLVNEACTNILGRSENELIGKRILEVIELKELILLLMEASQRSGEVVSNEMIIQKTDEPHEIHIIAIAKTLRDKRAKPLGVVTVLRDVTQEKEVSRMKANFLSAVSHELRTPLTSILMTYELLLQNSFGELNADQREYVSLSRVQGELLSVMIDNLIVLTSLESNQMELSKTAIMLKELALEASASVAKESALAKGLQFTHEIEENLPPIVGDDRKIVLVLKNLFLNAVKFTEQGEIRLCIHPVEEGIHISVADTGIGISKEYFEQIFEKFFQVDASVTREYGGSGIGLAICLAIVQAHQGKIWLESELHKGSTFHVILPLTPDAGLTIDD